MKNENKANNIHHVFFQYFSQVEIQWITGGGQSIILLEAKHKKTSIDVLPSKNQALCEYCTHLSKLKHC